MTIMEWIWTFGAAASFVALVIELMVLFRVQKVKESVDNVQDSVDEIEEDLN